MNAQDRQIWARTGKGTRIGTARDMVAALRDGARLAQWLASQARSLGFDFDAAAQGFVEAEINHGRWIVRCPMCSGAEDVAPTEPIFYCLSCGNADVDGHVMAVEFPADRESIEAELLKRPEMENRNWMPGQSQMDLLWENIEHGLDNPGYAN